MSYKLRETTKLHYGKFLYKMIIHNDLAFLFSSYNSKSRIQALLDDIKQQLTVSRIVTVNRWRKLQIDSDVYDNAMRLNELFNNSSSEKRLRIENAYNLYLYTSDEQLVNDILNTVSDVREYFKPSDDAKNFLANNFNNIIVNHPPEYEYKIFLKGNVNPSFSDWLDANQDKSKVGEITLFNIKNGYYNNGNYFYVKNDKVLTIVQMIISQNIRKIEKLIYKNDIDKYMYDNSK